MNKTSNKIILFKLTDCEGCRIMNNIITDTLYEFANIFPFKIEKEVHVRGLMDNTFIKEFKLEDYPTTIICKVINNKTQVLKKIVGTCTKEELKNKILDCFS